MVTHTFVTDNRFDLHWIGGGWHLKSMLSLFFIYISDLLSYMFHLFLQSLNLSGSFFSLQILTYWPKACCWGYSLKLYMEFLCPHNKTPRSWQHQWVRQWHYSGQQHIPVSTVHASLQSQCGIHSPGVSSINVAYAHNGDWKRRSPLPR